MALRPSALAPLSDTCSSQAGVPEDFIRWLAAVHLMQASRHEHNFAQREHTVSNA